MNNQIMGLVAQIKNGQNPEQVMMNFLQRQNTPMGVNLLNLVQQNRIADIEQIARNIVSQQGKDFDTEFKAFKQQLGLK